MRHLTLLLGLLVLTLSAAAPAQQPAAKYDLLTTKAGKVWQGMVLDESPTEVRFQIVQRKPGRPVVVFTTSFIPAEIKKLDKLAAKDRENLVDRLHRLDPAAGVELKLAGFTGADYKERVLLSGASLSPLGVAVFVAANRLEDLSYREGWSYESDQFLLVSNAGDEVVRRVAVRLEQIYATFAYFLPPVGRPAKPNTTTSIRLIGSLADYQELLRSQGRDIFNLAAYDAARNEIVCGAELTALGRQLAELHRQHDELRDRLRKQEAELKKLPRGEVQDRARKQLQEARLEIAQAGARNDELFHQATRQMFRALYHEAFHAYLANFVFPPNRGEVPRWLNEGLAQIFEEATADGIDLRVGPAPTSRLERLQELLKGTDHVDLAELLKASPAQFVVAHGLDRPAADRLYLVSWALAHYLMFERRLIGTPAMDDYLTTLNGKIDPKSGAAVRGAPAEALAKFTGRPLADLGKELYQYILTKMAKSP